MGNKNENLINRRWREYKRNPNSVPVATKEQTEYIERSLMKYCSIYFDQVETLSEIRFAALLERACRFDIERGLGAGQVPHLRYIHSEEFNQWEEELWRRINLRLDKLLSKD